jgi:hypothetical protein
MPGRGRPFPKGLSGNPHGRPKLHQNITELARAHCPRAIEVLAELMNNPKATAAARAMAADHILDRAYGKAPQAVAVLGAPNRPIEQLSDAELLAIIAGGQPRPSASAEPEVEQPPLGPKKLN